MEFWLQRFEYGCVALQWATSWMWSRDVHSAQYWSTLSQIYTCDCHTGCLFATTAKYTQKNAAVSKVNKKFISHLTRAQRTPSAAVNCPSFSCATSSSLLILTAGLWGVSKMASQQEKAFCVLRFEVSRSVITVQREFRARFRLWLAHALITI